MVSPAGGLVFLFGRFAGQRLMQLHLPSEQLGLGGEAPAILFQRGMFAQLFAEQVFAVNDVASRLVGVGPGRQQGEVLLGGDALAAPASVRTGQSRRCWRP